jgi:probable rRNA maturation factor
VRVGWAGPRGRPALPPTRVRRIVTAVLDGERAGDAAVSVTFLSAARMRALNRKTFGRRTLTDVIAFGLPHAGIVGGDVYVCPAAAARGPAPVTPLQELVRLVVHGTLHVLGYDHPTGPGRLRSAMWRRQERYVRSLVQHR